MLGPALSPCPEPTTDDAGNGDDCHNEDGRGPCFFFVFFISNVNGG